ncbi:substrate-binding domain-containing protein [Streptomyces sp. NPDC058067]|uniref:substrate-binding domain-containing protein n=1 Tax=Streptomyces sp. NPDC058067 TaxID=3346324 RepID=UPI0036F0CBFC
MFRAATFYMEFAFGGAQGASADGYDLTLFAQRGAREGGFMVDGAVVVDPLPGDDLLTRLLDSGLPVVTAGRVMGRTSPHAVVEIPHGDLAHRMFDRLRARGARRIAFARPAPDFPASWVTDMGEAYENWCADVGQEPALRSLTLPGTGQELAEVIDELIALPGGDALVVAAEGWAAWAKRILAARGLEAGRSFQLGTLSGDPVTELPDPVITCVRLGARQFADEAFVLLLDILAGTAERDAHRMHQAALVTDELG